MRYWACTHGSIALALGCAKAPSARPASVVGATGHACAVPEIAPAVTGHEVGIHEWIVCQPAGWRIDAGDRWQGETGRIAWMRPAARSAPSIAAGVWAPAPREPNVANQVWGESTHPAPLPPRGWNEVIGEVTVDLEVRHDVVPWRYHTSTAFSPGAAGTAVGSPRRVGDRRRFSEVW